MEAPDFRRVVNSGARSPGGPGGEAEAVLRRVIEIARSYTAPCKGLDRLAQDPGEYAVVAAMANLGPDTESFLRQLHAIHADDDFPAAIVDPDGRRGRPVS